MLRAIHLFPEFSNGHSINAIREKYDPLADLISPHVTLVFPFECDVSTEALALHLQESMVGLKPFRIVMTGVTGADGEYLFLNVKVGNDQIIQLHDKLYTGLLKQYLHRSLTYTPHLTIGRLKDKQIFEFALTETENWNEVFETTVHQVVVERIDEHENSIIEMKVPLIP
ncbi:2'-5' RNA ligase family protein [Alicyclobacillus mengziensis]|uniref:2'-5' RNA ligase family protein n=1 Tax=Alicyclobacillus mengziensis TaxID=2931921 RepID=A0A9X7VXL3_9BACL|nr:2'-5' RNA ligase family protein [Alicyclobacillus mengziensis]QSO45638.1 2'-5' RNA ligase family protein [Alicyclobacillus mengziensis]